MTLHCIGRVVMLVTRPPGRRQRRVQLGMTRNEGGPTEVDYPACSNWWIVISIFTVAVLQVTL